eukprot:TRINITY_DN30245_c0_g1_i1.p1 TRINITY_DN30245_c0_g1~~TRINITY_DN30245_c0_g1_i1.p1  ORF type:complete len:128 (-),score=21.90 TRINITY_DN30245_c0_g1_i1:147-530(-)
MGCFNETAREYNMKTLMKKEEEKKKADTISVLGINSRKNHDWKKILMEMINGINTDDYPWRPLLKNGLRTYIAKDDTAFRIAALAELYDYCVSNPQDSDYKIRCEGCLLYTSPSPRDLSTSRMPSSA